MGVIATIASVDPAIREMVEVAALIVAGLTRQAMAGKSSRKVRDELERLRKAQIALHDRVDGHINESAERRLRADEAIQVKTLGGKR